MSNQNSVVPLGFEPRSAGPEPTMMDRYTKGLTLRRNPYSISIKRSTIL